MRDDVRGRHREAEEDDAAPAGELLGTLMLAAGQPTISAAAIDAELDQNQALDRAGQLRAGVAVLRRRGVLNDPDDTSPAEFFHQTFFEYAAARAVTSLGDTGMDLLLARTEQQAADFWLAAVTQQTLIYACRSVFNSARIDAGFARLLSSADDAVVQMAVAAYAQARTRGPLARAAAAHLLASAHDGLIRRYLSYLPRVRHDVLAPVLDELKIVWSRDSISPETRVEVLGVLRCLAARDPHEVMTFVEDPGTDKDPGIDWLRWFTALPPDEARRRRQAPLGLVEALAEVDEEWAAARLLDIARVVTDGAGTQDALAPVLAAGARVLTAGRQVRALLSTVPSNIKIKDSGIGPLKLAMAGLHRRVWLAEGRELIQLVPEIIGTGSDSDSEVKDPDALIVMRRTQLWALAELAHSADPAVVRALLNVVLACRKPRAQSDVADYFLRRLLEGEHRLPVPGAPGPSPGPVADLARNRCAAAIGALDRSAAKTDGGRDVAALWRDSLDHADVPPAVVADLVRRVPATAMAGSQRWLSPSDLAALVVPAAFGGHSPARNALRSWARRRVPATQVESRLARRIIARRLGRLAVEHSCAVSLLIADAKIETDGSYLYDAVQQPGALRAEHADALLDTARHLLDSRTPDVRQDGYRLLVALVPIRRAGHRAIIDAVTLERGIGALNAAINLLEAELHDSGTQPWSPAEFAALESALERLAGSAEVNSEAPTTEIAGRAQMCLRLLYCRHGVLEPEAVRCHVLDRIRALTLGSNEQDTLAPLGFFMSRLTAVDPNAAADFLVEASVHVQGLPDGSWAGSPGTSLATRDRRRRRAIAAR